MKYVVELRRDVIKTVVVDAKNQYEAERKLERNEVEYEYERVTSLDTYNGYEYVSHESYSGEDKETLICNLTDLAEYLGVAEHEIGRYLYRNSACGLGFSNDILKITLVGYVECDCECDVSPTETLWYPFTVNAFEKTIRKLEIETDDLWNELNGDGKDDTLDDRY